MQVIIKEETKKKIEMALEKTLIMTKFESDIVKKAVRIGLDPVQELESAIKVLNDVKEDGEVETHVAEILEELKRE